MLLDKQSEKIKLRSAICELAYLPRLRKLDIALKQSTFKREDAAIQYRSQDPSDDIDEFNVPGLHKLRAMRYRTEITFYGDCPDLATYFKAEPIAYAGGEELESRIEQENGFGNLESE